MNIFDFIREQAAQAPDRPAVRTGTGQSATTLTYGQLIERVDQVAELLRKHGIEPGQRIGVTAPQGTRFIETALGIIAADACMVPIPDEYSATVIAQFANRAHLHHLVTLPPNPDGALQFHAYENGDLEASAEKAFREIRPAYLRFTSGTTNTRKGVVLGHQRIAERLEAANEALTIGPDDAVLWLLPMAHHFIVSILLYLRFGATILLPAKSLAGPILDTVAEGNATVLYASPYHMNLLAKDPSDKGLSSLRLVISTAEGLRGEIAQRFQNRFGRSVSQALGIMEAGLTVLNSHSAANKPQCLGRPLPAYEVWLRAEDGARIETPSPDHTGEICIRGPGLLDAYLDPWIPASELLEPDGFRTGDQGWFDADGDLHLAGRRTNRINMAGMKFFCEEVEAVLDSHLAIERSRVSSKIHPHLGELPIAEILLAPDAEEPTRKELIRFCGERLARYMIPREFRVVDELPMTATGKLARH